MVQWLALVVALFLAPGAVALGSMGLALAAGAADVALRDRPAGLRCAGVFAAGSAAALAWSGSVLWLAAHTPAPPLLPVSIAAAVVAVAPSLRVFAETVRDGSAGRETALALGAATLLNGAIFAGRLLP